MLMLCVAERSLENWVFFTGRDHCLLRPSAQMAKTRQDHDAVL